MAYVFYSQPLIIYQLNKQTSSQCIYITDEQTPTQSAELSQEVADDQEGERHHFITASSLSALLLAAVKHSIIKRRYPREAAGLRL